MKKTIFSTVFAAVAGLAAVLFSQNEDSRGPVSTMAFANIEALSDIEGPYRCSPGCLEWKGNNGGGIACDCERYIGSCKRRCP